ncbi:putative Coiled-coil domain-containing protein 55-domain containing protein [Seiridium cardinale]|uniref:Coiled-coil domain-containing protein 55-domain containing protein n=1 Tax=Seiridium cardinale TaxID=138064 RepID=A0ABR2Y6D9_9PEZI
MSKPGLSFGLNLAKKPGAKPAPSKSKPPGGMFGGGDDSDSDNNEPEENVFSKSSSKSKVRPGAPPLAPPKPKKSQISVYGDLSSALESRKNAEAAEELDPSIYDYDGVYDSIKPEKKTSQDDAERRPKYMKNLIASAAVRKRDALIAEEKKIAREREAEGEEFADKEKFVTEAYKKQQEENRRLEEEEKRREEEESRKNKGGGMTAFYKDLLNRGDQRHTEMMKAAEDRAKNGPQENEKEETSEDKVTSATDRAKEINAKGGSIAINEDGDVVDKRELLKGGLNVGAKKRPEVRQDDRRSERRDDRDSRGGLNAGGKNAMRERQSRMMEAQLEQALKRSLEEEEEERQKVERAAKSRKTDTDISSAKERYLARKKAAEEAKKNGS